MIGYLTQDYPLIQAFRPRPAVRRSRQEDLLRNRVFKAAPKLADYFGEGEVLAVKGSLDRPISGLVMDSRRVVPGSLFFALPGRSADGASFIDEACNRGAVAVVTAKLPALPPGKVTFIQVADPRVALARVAQRYYKFPDRDLTVVGVAGTSGKTSVVHLLRHLLNGDQRVGLLSTVHYDLGARTVPSFRTTPESLDIHGMMAQMRDNGCRQMVMEVSAEGSERHSVLGLQMSAAIFTNLSRDAHFAVMSRLFTGGTGPAPKVAVVNLDDPAGGKLAGTLVRDHAGVRLVTFGENHCATVRAEQVELHATRACFRLVWPGGAMQIEAPLVGRGNVSNLLAATAAAWALGRDPVVFLARLRACPGVPGRMERIDAGQLGNVFVDYAHTADALRHALGVLRPLTPGRLFVVFGCGGNRARAERPLMVRAAQEFADFTFATADNPRAEGLAPIFADMLTGVTAPEKISWVSDRRRAISLALAGARAGDCVLIAGKGHESYQEFADTVVPFDDRQVVRELLALPRPGT